MIEIPEQLRIGSTLYPLARAYDNGGTARKVLKRLREEHALHAVRHAQVAQKKLVLIYCDPSKV